MRGFKWFVDGKSYDVGDSCGYQALKMDIDSKNDDDEKISYHQTIATCTTETVCLAVLNRKNFLRIVNRIKLELDKDRIHKIRSIPYFSEFQPMRIRKLLSNTKEIDINKGQYLIR